MRPFDYQLIRQVTRRVRVAVACCFAVPSSASTPPPTQPFDSATWLPISKSKPASELRLGEFLVRYEETTLADLVSAAGLGDIQQQGDAGGSIYWLCYTTGNDQRLWIIAHGEMGGSNHAVTDIAVQRIAKATPDSDCPSLPAEFQPLSFASGLWISATEGEVLAILGNASYSQGPWRVYDYSVTVPGNCEPNGYDLSNSVFLRFSNDQVDTIISGQVTSC